MEASKTRVKAELSQFHRITAIIFRGQHPYMRIRMSCGARARGSSIRGVQKPQPSRKKKYVGERTCVRLSELRLIINLDRIASCRGSRRCVVGSAASRNWRLRRFTRGKGAYRIYGTNRNLLSSIFRARDEIYVGNFYPLALQESKIYFEIYFEF